MIYHRTIHYTSPQMSHPTSTLASSWRAFVPGAGLIAMGLAILFVPQLLVAFVASIFLSLGAVALVAAWRIRKALDAAEAANRSGHDDVDPWFGTPVEELLVRFSQH